MPHLVFYSLQPNFHQLFGFITNQLVDIILKFMDDILPPWMRFMTRSVNPSALGCDSTLLSLLSSPVIPGSNIRSASASRNLWDWSFPKFTQERSAQRGAGSCNFGNLHLNQGDLRKRACERGMWAVALL